jgi:hypothetical protein
MILRSSKPREIGGVILEYATPASRYWDDVVRVMASGGSSYVVGIPRTVCVVPDGTVSVYVLTG